MAFVQFLRQNAGHLWLAGGLTVAVVPVYSHTFGLEAYRHETTAYKYGVASEVDKEVLALAEEIKDELKWPSFPWLDRDAVDFYPSTNLEFSHKGNMYTYWKAVIGLPPFFSEKSFENTEDKQHIFRKYKIDLNSEKGTDIINTYRLSASAKKFALAKEMCHVRNLQVYADYCGTALTAVIMYGVANALSQLLRFPGSKLLSFACAVPTVGAGYLKYREILNDYMNRSADNKASSISPKVAEGKEEYYESVLIRKRIIESVIGSEKQLDNENRFFGDLKKVFGLSQRTEQ